MHITPSMASRDLLASLDTLNEQLDTVSQQISTGKRMVHLRDSPAAGAESVLLAGEAAKLDQYKANTDSGNFYLQVADSVLNSVQNLVTSIQTKGSAATSDTASASDCASLAEEVRSLRDQVLSLANSEVRGRYIFAGSKITSAPFVISIDAVTYQGDDEINKISVDDGLQVQQNIPGSSVFSPIFDAIQSMLAAMDAGDHAGIGAAVAQMSSSLGGLNLARGQVGAELGKLENASLELDTEAVNLRAQQSRVEDANAAEAATRLSQLQTALKTTLAVGQSILQQHNLFDFLG